MDEGRNSLPPGASKPPTVLPPIILSPPAHKHTPHTPHTKTYTLLTHTHKHSSHTHTHSSHTHTRNSCICEDKVGEPHQGHSGCSVMVPTVLAGAPLRPTQVRHASSSVSARLSASVLLRPRLGCQTLTAAKEETLISNQRFRWLCLKLGSLGVVRKLLIVGRIGTGPRGPNFGC